jgi:hypothetical protein
MIMKVETHENRRVGVGGMSLDAGIVSEGSTLCATYKEDLIYRKADVLKRMVL